MLTYEAAETMRATPDEVWAVLGDVAHYPDWDSGSERVEGDLGPGATLKVFSAADPGRAFPVKVAELEPGAGMTWRGGMPLGLFKGVRRYRLEAAGAVETRFEMREQFSGPLLPLIARAMPDLQPSFDQFARGLKPRVEGGVGG